MIERPSIPKHPVGRTFSVCVWVLGLVALAQVVAVGWAVLGRAHGPATDDAAAVDATGVLDGGQAAATAEKAGAEKMTAAGSPGANAATGIEPASMDLATPPGVGPGTPPVPPSNLVIEDTKVLALLEAAETLRAREDLQGVLARLREADALLPNHPKILYDIAGCLKDMGLLDQATQEWEKIHAMGPEIGGDFWTLADVNLKSESRVDAASSNALLTVSNVLVQRHPEVSNGERVTLRVAIKARAGEEILPRDVVVNVFFYDLVNGKRVARTTADQPRYNWTTFPIDWKDQPEEILDVEYFHPELSPAEIRELGKRQYYGYIIEVHYRDGVQDVVAEPRTLRNLEGDSSNPLLNNPLFPK